jgi:oligoendopeptidase F
MTVVYPSIDSPEFEEGFQSAIDAIDSLRDLFDKHEIARRLPGPLDDDTVKAFDEIIDRYNATQEQISTLRAYLEAFTATDSRDNLAQARLSELQGHLVKLSQLATRLTAWIGSLDTDNLLLKSQTARDHEYFLQRSKIRATHQMSPAEESLAAELSLSSGSAWNKLHNNVTSQLAVPVDIPGYPSALPMSVVRTLASESDREVRRKAYEAELKGWEKAAIPLAAALNSI